jgi:hypothetical protein
MTALVYFYTVHKAAFIAGTVHYSCTVQYINKSHGAAVHGYNSTETGLHRAPPELWPHLGGVEVRGPSFEAVSAGVADSAAVETVTATMTALVYFYT